MEQEKEIQQLSKRNQELEEENNLLKNQIIKISNKWESECWENLGEIDKIQHKIEALNKLTEAVARMSYVEQK
uniref:Uncharacterized protein n=1 Tax=Panagrolaimus sp. ES5 TaxID=591445 RepID=A0AC34FY41_9BILA